MGRECQRGKLGDLKRQPRVKKSKFATDSSRNPILGRDAINFLENLVVK